MVMYFFSTQRTQRRGDFYLIAIGRSRVREADKRLRKLLSEKSSQRFSGVVGLWPQNH